MKKIALVLIGLIIVGLAFRYTYDARRSAQGEIDNFATWQTFVPGSGLFQVSLPNAPQYAKDLILIPGTEIKRRYDMYASEQVDGTLFLISVISYPADYDVSSSNDLLHANIDELMTHKKDNHLIKISQRNLGAYNSFDFIFENQEFKVEGTAIHDDHLVYMLSYVTKKDDFDQEEFIHFIESFRILIPSKDVVKKKVTDY